MATLKTKSKNVQAKDVAGIGELRYYFDAQTKDQFDTGQISHRNAQLMAMREQLLTLPPGEFEAAMRTLANIAAKTIPESKAKKPNIAESLYHEKVPVASAVTSAAQVRKI